MGEDLPAACAAQIRDVLGASGDGLLVHPGRRTLRAWQLFEEDGLRTQVPPQYQILLLLEATLQERHGQL